MSCILVAIDFSPCSQTATRIAAALAAARGLPVVLVHAVDTPAMDIATIPIGGTVLEMDLLIAAEAKLVREAALVRRGGLEVEPHALLGAPVGVILDAARKHEAELIVVGTHGRQGVTRFLLGSIAEDIVRRSPVPVLVAHEEASDLDRWRGGQPLRLAVGVDGSSASEAAMTWTGHLAQTQPCELSLTRVFSPKDEAAHYGLDADAAPERDLLPLLERDLQRDAGTRLRHVPRRLELLAAGDDAAKTLVDAAVPHGADALVVGIPRHGSGPGAALLPAAVLRASPFPVFCVPDPVRPAPEHLVPVRSVLVAVDLSETSNDVVQKAYGLSPVGGRVELCTVHELGPNDGLAEVPLVTPLTPEEHARTDARLRSLIPVEAESRGIVTRVSVIEAPFAVEAIVAAAERLDVDVVAVGSHGRSGLGRVLLGSVAEDVARRCARPVLIVRLPSTKGRVRQSTV